MDKQKLVKTGIFVAIAAGVAFLALGYGRHLLRLDPFANFDKKLKGGDIMASFKDVDVVQYDKDKLMGSAHVGELVVRQDQQTYDLSHVYNGILYTDDGQIDFSADNATWDAGRLTFATDTGAQVKDKDFDLHVASFNFNQNTGELKVPSEIHGRFFGGEISAKTFLYNANSKSGSVGPAVWTGKPNLQQDTGDTNPTVWTFHTDGIVYHKGGIEVWNKASATDGEIIVQGDTIERNEKTDVITATGNCLYFSKKANMACDKVVVYRKDKHAVLTGNVRMLIKPKDSMERELKADTGEVPVFHPDVPGSVAAQAQDTSGETQADRDADDEVRSGKTTRKYPTVLLANEIEYWYAKGSRHAVVTGSPQATQMLQGNRWRRVWATKALYDGEQDSVRLLSSKDNASDVIMKNSTGDDIQATWFEFSTQEDNENWTGKGLKGNVVQTENDEDNSTPPATTNPPPADAGKKPPL